MDKPRLSLVVARALICAAWADGSIDSGERDFLDAFLNGLPEVSQSERMELREMLNHQPLQSDILITFKALREAATLKEDRQYVLKTVRDIFETDGKFCEKEATFLQTLDRLLHANNENFYQEMSKVLKSLKF